MLRLRETERGLGADSEAWVESVHIDFWRVWCRFRVRDQSRAMYAENLTRAVCVMNASHCPQPPYDHVDNGRGAQSLEQTDSRNIDEGPVRGTHCQLRTKYYFGCFVHCTSSIVCIYAVAQKLNTPS